MQRATRTTRNRRWPPIRSIKVIPAESNPTTTTGPGGADDAQMQGELNLVGVQQADGRSSAAARNQVKQERADYTKKLTDVESTLATKASADDVKAIGTMSTASRPTRRHQGEPATVAGRARKN